MARDYPNKMYAEQVRQFQLDVCNIVGQIPYGRVMTYGEIASLCGWPDHSRMVGRTLRNMPGCASLPCHRVVNAVGRTAPVWIEQRMLLEREGVEFLPNGKVDLKRFLWKPEAGI